MVGRLGLGKPDIPGVPGKLASLQRAHDRVPIADFAARGVDEIRPRFIFAINSSSNRCSVSGCNVREPIIGIQVHHAVFLDAHCGAANACAGRDSAIVRTGANDLIELLWRLRGLARELSEVRDRLRGRLLSLSKEEVIRCK